MILAQADNKAVRVKTSGCRLLERHAGNTTPKCIQGWGSDGNQSEHDDTNVSTAAETPTHTASTYTHTLARSTDKGEDKDGGRRGVGWVGGWVTVAGSSGQRRPCAYLLASMRSKTAMASHGLPTPTSECIHCTGTTKRRGEKAQNQLEKTHMHQVGGRGVSTHVQARAPTRRREQERERDGGGRGVHLRRTPPPTSPTRRTARTDVHALESGTIDFARMISHTLKASWKLRV